MEAGEQREEDLEHALDLMRRHGTLDATEAEARRWALRADAAMRELPEHPLRAPMIALADYVVTRLS